VAAATPDEVRLQRDDRIAAAPGAALDALEQEGVRPPVADLQEGGDRRLQVVDQPRPDKLGRASLVCPLEGRILRLDAHFARPGFPAGLPATALGSIGSRPMATRARLASTVT